MANQATIATGTYDPFTNGRDNVLRQFRESLAPIIVGPPSFDPPVSTARRPPATRAEPARRCPGLGWGEPTHRTALEKAIICLS